MRDELGNRMKDFYENRTKQFLPRRTFTIIRIDGKAFHTYTRGFKRPFDDALISWMDQTAIYLCDNIQGAKFAYVQSDEISLLLTDFDNLKTDSWFDGSIQKMVSISSSLATAGFNKAVFLSSLLSTKTITHFAEKPWAQFDSRVFTIPFWTEVENYFIWRQQDATRNSIQSVAQSLYSHKELNGKNQSDLQEMIFQKGINWNDYAAKYKRGRMIIQETYMKNEVERKRWVVGDPPIFTQDKNYLKSLLPEGMLENG